MHNIIKHTKRYTKHYKKRYTKRYKKRDTHNTKILKNSMRGGSLKILNTQKLTKEEEYKMSRLDCPDLNDCKALGINIYLINSFFKNFTTFEYLLDIAYLNSGVNSNIQKLEYKRLTYTTHAILKTPLNTESDNLMYEYEVGQYINKQLSFFPCFIETYGLFYNKTDGIYKKNNNNNLDLDNLKKKFEHIDKIDYKMGCLIPDKMSILLQHIDSYSFENFLKQYIEEAVQTDVGLKICDAIICILYQVLFPLSVLGKTFTHNDLHTENILLYKIKNDLYIRYNYHLHDGTVITFNSQYIAKIIDYGRSFYLDKINGTGTDITIKNIDEIIKADNSKKDPESVFSVVSCNSFSNFKRTNTTNDYQRLIAQIYSNGTFFGQIYKDRKNIDAHFLEILEKSIANISTMKPKTDIYVKGEIKSINDCCGALSEYILKYKDLYMHAIYTELIFGVFNIYSDGREMQFTKS